jgi:hypothetical protein
MNRRQLRFLGTPPLSLQKLKFKLFAVLSCGSEIKSAVPSLGTVSLGSFSSQASARRIRVFAKGCRTFGGKEVVPNPSVKRSAAGRPPGPGWRYAVHCRQPGPGVLPSSPAYLER